MHTKVVPTLMHSWKAVCIRLLSTAFPHDTSLSSVFHSYFEGTLHLMGYAKITHAMLQVFPGDELLLLQVEIGICRIPSGDVLLLQVKLAFVAYFMVVYCYGLAAMDRLLWTDCYGLVAMDGCYGLVAMKWLLWTGCYGLVAMDWLLWTGCYGLVALDGFYGLVAMDCIETACYGLVSMDGCYGQVAMDGLLWTGCY